MSLSEVQELIVRVVRQHLTVGPRYPHIPRFQLAEVDKIGVLVSLVGVDVAAEPHKATYYHTTFRLRTHIPGVEFFITIMRC